MKKITSLILLALFASMHCFAQLHIEKRKHLKGFHIEWWGKQTETDDFKVAERNSISSSVEKPEFRDDPAIVHRTTVSEVSAAAPPTLNAAAPKKAPLAVRLLQPKLEKIERKFRAYIPFGAGLKKSATVGDEPLEVNPRNNWVAILALIFSIFSLIGIFTAFIPEFSMLAVLTLFFIPALCIAPTGRKSQLRQLAIAAQIIALITTAFVLLGVVVIAIELSNWGGSGI